jgi:hypothetical protein
MQRMGQPLRTELPLRDHSVEEPLRRRGRAHRAHLDRDLPEAIGAYYFDDDSGSVGSWLLGPLDS